MTDETTENKDEGSAPSETGISKKAYEEIKADLFKFKGSARELEAKNAELANQLKAAETKKLEESNQYKTLYEKQREENSKLQGSLLQVRDNFIKNEKLREIETKALASGLRPQALELLRSIASNTDEVVVEMTNTGRAQVVGVDTFIESLKSKYSDALFVDGSPPNVNTSMPNSNVENKKWTPTELLKLQKDDYKQYTKVMQDLISARS